MDRQPRRLVLERAREPRGVARPRHRADDHAVAPAAHPRSVGLHERQRRPEIQRPPAPTALTEIEPRAATPADPTAITLPPRRANRDDHLSLTAHPHVLDHRPLQSKQARPYPDAAHVVFRSPRFQPRTSRNPRRGAACAPFSAAHLTHGNSRSASNRRSLDLVWRLRGEPPRQHGPCFVQRWTKHPARDGSRSCSHSQSEAGVTPAGIETTAARAKQQSRRRDPRCLLVHRRRSASHVRELSFPGAFWVVAAV